LQYYEQVVRWAEERGLYVIVDFHQDAFSRYTVDGCGEGFPRWAVVSDSAFSQPDNSNDCVSWGYKMALYPSHHKTWSDFHQDREGIRSRYIEMVKKVADRMAKHRNVIGYDLLNEPWGSEQELLSLFTSAGDAIRSRHPQAILFIPAHTLIGAGFITNHMDRPKFKNMAYAPHFYDAGVMGLKRWFGNNPDRWLNQINTKAEQWQTPMLLGEFGAPANTINSAAYLETIYQWLDANFVSGTQWNYTPGWTEKNKDGWNAEDFSIVDNTGQVRKALFEPRAYPQKTAGQPLRFKRSDNGFKYTWDHNPKQGATLIFVPAQYQKNRILRIAGTAAHGATCHFEAQLLICRSSRSGPVSVALEYAE
jgi:endoglycosylceramidase